MSYNEEKKKKSMSVIIGKTIKALRMKRDLSQYELSERSNIDRSYISNVESGSHEPSVSKLFDLCKGLDIKPSVFFQIIENEYEKEVSRNPSDNDES